MKVATHQDLKNVYERAQDKLITVRKQFPWTHKEAYIGWLVQTYEYAFRSTRILALTGGMMPPDKTAFATRFIAHAGEEKGHERLLELDVKNFGLDIKALPVSSEAKAFHQSLYYWLGYNNPVGMFGWVLALEGFAVRNVPEMHEICLKEYGPKCTAFLRIHAAEDEDHLDKAFESIKSFTGEENHLVAETLTQYSDLYCNIFLKIMSETSRGRQAA